MQIEGEEAQRIAKRRLEHERGRKDATADMSEDLSEGEKGDGASDISAHGGSTKSRLPRITSVEGIEAWASQHKDKKLYIVLIRQVTEFLIPKISFFISPEVYNMVSWLSHLRACLEHDMKILCKYSLMAN